MKLFELNLTRSHYILQISHFALHAHPLIRENTRRNAYWLTSCLRPVLSCVVESRVFWYCPQLLAVWLSALLCFNKRSRPNCTCIRTASFTSRIMT
ncbi:hypothetical protein AMELA_G00216590, partial [Ameiurus melas]